MRVCVYEKGFSLRMKKQQTNQILYMPLTKANFYVNNEIK